MQRHASTTEETRRELIDLWLTELTDDLEPVRTAAVAQDDELVAPPIPDDAPVATPPPSTSVIDAMMARWAIGLAGFAMVLVVVTFVLERAR